MNHWPELAKNKKIRLPLARTRITPWKMGKWLERIGRTKTWFREWTGFSGYSDYLAANPDTSLREWVGLLLEEEAFDVNWAAFRKWEQEALSKPVNAQKNRKKSKTVS